MRLSGGFLLLSLIAVGVTLYLVKIDFTSSQDAVTAIATDLREEGVSGAVFDDGTAREMILAMESLVADPNGIPDHVEDLKTISQTTASWAKLAAVASPELHAAVMLRRAAGELRSFAITPSDRRLASARRSLDAASATLDGKRGGPAGASGAGPGLAVDAVRDQIENLEQAHQDQLREVDEELNIPD